MNSSRTPRASLRAVKVRLRYKNGSEVRFETRRGHAGDVLIVSAVFVNWGGTPRKMPVYIEKYVLPVLSAATVLFMLTNPMHWGWQGRAGGFLVSFMLAYPLAHYVHRKNTSRKNSLTKPSHHATNQSSAANESMTSATQPPPPPLPPPPVLALAPAPQAVTEPPKVVLPADVTPDFLLSRFRNSGTTAQAKAATSFYLGKWLDYSGVVYDITERYMFLQDEGETQLIPFKVAAVFDETARTPAGRFGRPRTEQVTEELVVKKMRSRIEWSCTFHSGTVDAVLTGAPFHCVHSS